jgi:hypothetical protein
MDFFIYVCKRRRMCVLQASGKMWETFFFFLLFEGERVARVISFCGLS